MNSISNIVTNSSEEDLEKILSPFIQEQFPSFMRENYRKLILVIKAYYEWLETKGNAGYVLSKLDTVYDIDSNAEEFYTHFKNTYLSTFPDFVGVDTDGNTPNKKTLLKKIRDFYGKKGTESAYKFLFRLLYDSDLELYYPKTDILKVSDGRWIEPKSIKTTVNNGSELFKAKGGQVFQYNGTQVSASAFVDTVVQYKTNGLPICEFFLSEILGDFIPNKPVKFVKDNSEWQEIPYAVLGQFYVELPGSGYRVGDTVSVDGYSTDGFGFSARIEQLGLAGSIKKIAITNSGLNYPTDVTLAVFSETGKRTAKVVGLRTAVTNYPGYFSGNRGKVSSNKNVFDGHYYQDFSYELKSSVSFDTYFDILKKIIHPAGLRMFGSILLNDRIDNTLSTSTQGTFSKVPLLGQYTPYTFRTYNNLRLGTFLPNQVRGATLQVWLSTYTVAGNTTDGITAGWTGAGLTALGVNVWSSLANGFTFGHYPAYSDVWSTPRFKQEAVNTHPSLVFRPVNDASSEFYVASTDQRWRSFGYGNAGPTMGRLGLTASRSYFVVCKPRRIDQIGAIGSAAGNGRHIVSDAQGFHGIAVGYTGGTSVLKIVGWNSGDSRNSWVVADGGATGEWKLISQVFQNGSGNSGPLSLFLNGICLGTTLSAAAPKTTTANQSLGIGMPSNTVDHCFDGEIAEIVCYQGNVSDVDRQKVEGYLAHKYDMADKLPSNHPYKTTFPGISLSGGTWGGGTTGDYYPKGYNPYIGLPTHIGADGTTASFGSLFYDSGLGYTYTVVDEHGVTAHNSTGSPLGSTLAWWDSGTTWGNKESRISPSDFDGLILWLKPENIGVCGAFVNGASADVWRDASPMKNDALPPTWGRFNGSGYANAGVTIDKLRPTICFGSVAGPTGVSFNGGVLYAPTTTWNGASLAHWIQMGNTHGSGTTAEKILTGQHLYLKNPISLSRDMSVFIVMRPTLEGYDRGLGLISSDSGLTNASQDDTVFYHRSYNTLDRSANSQNSTYYSVLNNGNILYPSTPPVGLVGFRPSGSKTGVQKNTLSYDPHVSGVCFGTCIGEWTRNTANEIKTYLNGDASKNYSFVTGRKIQKINPPSQAVLDALPEDVWESASSASQEQFNSSTVNLSRMGGYVRLSATSSQTTTNANWISDLTNSTTNPQFSFAGVISEVIVFNRLLSEEERQGVYGYLSRRYQMEKILPDSFIRSHNSSYASGATYWVIEHHPNTTVLDKIVKGSEFSGIVLGNFFSLAKTIYKSAGTRLSDGTGLTLDKYDTQGS